MRAFLIVLIFSAMAVPAHAKRVALVIGNDAYINVTPLKKAVNDANALALTLTDLGFDVLKEIDAPRRIMDSRLNELNNSIEAGDEVVIFFAGHGISVRGQNYLLPTDIPQIRPGQERSVTKEAFSENEIINILQERGAKVSILIIDACRNNPFPKAGTRTLGRSTGLSERNNPPRNTFIIYSAGIGQEALDRLSDSDLDPNSVFTRKLIPLLKTPGLSHVQMAKQLQIEVEQLALSAEQQHRQFPAFYDQVRGNFFFIPGDKSAQPPRVNATESPEELLWSTIQNSSTAEDYQFYLRKFPNGRFAHIAELNLQKLTPQPEQKLDEKSEERDVALLTPPPVRAAKLPELTTAERENDTGWIGVRIQDVQEDTYKSLGLEKVTGSLIANITEGGPASKADLKKGDVFIAVGDNEVTSSRELAKIIRVIEIGKTAQIKIRRGAEIRTTTVEIRGYLTSNWKLAKAGNPEALKTLAAYYEHDKDNQESQQKALAYHRLAAETGDRDAMYNLANFYQYDRGALKKQPEEAFKWHQKAASKGHPNGQFNVAFAYRMGQGVEKDYNKALEYYNLAASQGLGMAMLSIGEIYEGGEGVSKNMDEAMSWYRKASDKNVWQASLKLGKLFVYGAETPKNLLAAENYLKKASDNSPEAKHYLAVIYDNGENRAKDPVAAANLLYDALLSRYETSYTSITNHPTAWSKEFRQEIQKKLQSGGHYNGPIDGEFGESTKAAIKKVYQ